MADFTLTILGARGSVPCAGQNFSHYGGDTTCLLVQAGEDALLIDMGTGALHLSEQLPVLPAQLPVLITHPHLDHLQALPMFGPAFSGQTHIRIYGAERAGRSLQDQIATLMQPPLWPVGTESFAPSVSFLSLPQEPFRLGKLCILHAEGAHPGGCTMYRIEYEGRSIIFTGDFEHTADAVSPEAADAASAEARMTEAGQQTAKAGGAASAGEADAEARLLTLARDCDLLVYDGHYTKEQYGKHRGWGHSYPEKGAELARRAGAKRLLITHHSPQRRDREAAEEELLLQAVFPNSAFAVQGQVIAVDTGESLQAQKPGQASDAEFLDRILDLGIALSAERDKDKLLELILCSAMDITGADGGTLYIKGEDGLSYKVMITRSTNFHKGGTKEPVTLAPLALVPQNASSYSALTNTAVNIPDVYNTLTDQFDFTGPRKFDAATGYKTTSMMCVPMDNDDGEVIGVMQLINATDHAGTVIAFGPEEEKIVASIASQAAICLTNMNYAADIMNLLDNFVQVMSTAIDARSPYNANHSRSMAAYAEKFIDWINGQANAGWRFSDEERRQFLMSVWLHDIGKLVVPLEVMDKQTRLGALTAALENRFGRAELLCRLAHAEGRLSHDAFAARLQQLTDMQDFIRRCDCAGFMDDGKLEQLAAYAAETYTEQDGSDHPLLTAEDVENLSIRKGTLTAAERGIIESHVTMTAALLSKIAFPRQYEKVPAFSGSHHEFLNGRGYPNHLTAEQLPREVRLLTILDVYDALTAKDRPYKAPLPPEEAFRILGFMVKDGQADPDILALFKESHAWDRE